jgi:hypothetical protein
MGVGTCCWYSAASPPSHNSPRQHTLDLDMTSDVKSCEPLFLGLHHVFALRAAEEAEPVKPTVDPADIRGLITT